MLCRLYTEEGLGRCDAVEDQHVPTVLERERYCRCEGRGCPILRGYVRRGRRLKVAEYLDTYSGPPTEFERG